jgi:hypothetical protein
MKMAKKVLIGIGILSWDSEERKSDRYGSVYLHTSVGSESLPLEVVKGYGQLEAIVLKTRQSNHLGDWSRGIYPGGAKKGMKVVLGQGNVFLEQDSIGLSPLKKRSHDWLSPKALYRLHSQTVELWFVPKLKPKKVLTSKKKLK